VWTKSIGMGCVILISTSWLKTTTTEDPTARRRDLVWVQIPLFQFKSRPTGRCGYDNCASDGTTGAGNTGFLSPVQPSSRARNPNRCH